MYMDQKNLFSTRGMKQSINFAVLDSRPREPSATPFDGPRPVDMGTEEQEPLPISQEVLNKSSNKPHN